MPSVTMGGVARMIFLTKTQEGSKFKAQIHPIFSTMNQLCLVVWFGLLEVNAVQCALFAGLGSTTNLLLGPVLRKTLRKSTSGCAYMHRMQKEETVSQDLQRVLHCSRPPSSGVGFSISNSQPSHPRRSHGHSFHPHRRRTPSCIANS